MEGDEARQPIRVVVFTSGPILERGVRQFLARLDQHPQIALLACIGQARVNSRWAAYTEVWRRRGLLAIPILLTQMAEAAWRRLRYYRAEAVLERGLNSLADRISFVPDVHAEGVLEQVRALAPDLGLIYGAPMLRPALFEIPAHGTLGIHHGKAPQYRGKKTMFWAMHNREQSAGVIIQRVNAGLDTGDIVKEGEVLIGGRPPRAVWHELEALGLDLYVQAILEVRAGTATFKPQAGERRRPYGDPAFRDVLRYWMRRFHERHRPPAERHGNTPRSKANGFR